MLQHSNGNVGGIFPGGSVFYFFLVVGVVAILSRPILAGGAAFREVVPHAAWLGAAAAGRKPQIYLPLELRDLFPHLSLTATPGR